MTTRRELLRSSLGAALLASGQASPLRGLARLAWRAARSDRPHLDAALRAAAWIHRARQVTEHGVAWPADPHDPTSIGTTLYTGTPGIVLFLLELHDATGDRAFLDEASAGADYLAATLPSEDDPKTGFGFYEGVAGVAYTLQRAHRASGNTRHGAAADRAVAMLKRRARAEGNGVTWGDDNDIIAGTAGTLLFLLWWAEEKRDRASVELASQGGRHLLDRAQDVPTGKLWRPDSKYPHVLPNFSHGTAGVAYALASLHAVTGDRAALHGALAGARQLLSIARTTDDSCAIYHHDGGGEDLFYLSWCHGPAGTARLFHRLGLITRDPQWASWVRRCGRGIRLSGIPEQRTPGFWNNVSQCCGNTGVAQFFLDLHRQTGDAQHLVFARRVTDDLMHRATNDDQGLRWVQAENRIDPNGLVAQTGRMQGAAGMGSWLLHLDAFEHGRSAYITLPDSPFG